MDGEITRTIALIRYHHRNRCFAMETRKAMDLRLGWFLKTQLGWSKALPADERSAIAKQAKAIVDAAEKAVKGKEAELPDGYDDLGDIVEATIMARKPFDEIEAGAKKNMAQLAESLPIAEWAAAIRGFGPVSLAIIVAECGDLSNYANPGKVWKRMGVAVVGDVRQGGLSKTAPKADWIEHGYSRIRRSRMWNIGDALIKGNGDGYYRQVYLVRKEYERDKAEAEELIVAPAASIPKGRAAEYRSDGHIHRRAQRYMEKRLLKHIWQKWNAQPVEDEVIPLAAE